MKNTITKFCKRIPEWFPLIPEWARFPGFIGWIGLSAGIACGALLRHLLGFSSIFYNEILLVAIILSLLCGLACGAARFRMLWFSIAGIALVCQGYSQQCKEYSSINSRLGTDTRARLCGAIVSVPEQSRGRYSFLVKCDSVFSLEKPGVLKGKCVTCYSERMPPVSGGFSAMGRFAAPRPAANPGGFDEYLFSLSNNIWGKFYCDSLMPGKESRSLWQAVTSFARTTVVAAASSMKNHDARAVLVASFINDRSDLTDSVKDLFFKAGIFHLLALSGFNLAILSAAIFAFLMLFPVSREIKLLIVFACIWSYLFFIGPIPSLTRAVLMTSVVLASFLFQRKPYLINSLGIAGIVWLIFSPLSLFTPGYQLSFGATFGLAALYPALSGLFGIRGPQASPAKKASAPLLTALLVSVAAFCATGPILAWHFGTLSLSGIIVNLFAVFLMSLAMWTALAGFFLQIIIPPLAPLCMHAAELCIILMLKCAGLVSLMPLSTVQLPRFSPLIFVAYALFITGFCVIKRGLVRRYLLLGGTVTAGCIAALIVIQYAAVSPQIVLFSSKKAAISGIRFPNGRIWLSGLGEEVSESAFSRIISPWMRLAPGTAIESVLLSGDPCNAVQSLEPVLKNRRGITVFSIDSASEKCPEFLSFLSEYGAKLSTIKSQRNYLPSPHCTLEVGPSYDDQGDTVLQCAVSMFDTRYEVPDALHPPSDEKGATIITFRNGRPPTISSAIPAWHPLNAGKRQ